ncbi:hypothetical protein FB451DRAFT_696790 [Mycena latifolia]|nr:hypothetical protein FB451DRAFT_696790 [Mycena latifolia]
MKNTKEALSKVSKTETQLWQAYTDLSTVDVVSGAGSFSQSQLTLIADATNPEVGMPSLVEPFNQVVLITNKAMGKLTFVNAEDLPKCLADLQPKLVAFVKSKGDSCDLPGNKKRADCSNPSTSASASQSHSASSVSSKSTSAPVKSSSSQASSSGTKSKSASSFRVNFFPLSGKADESRLLADFYPDRIFIESSEFIRDQIETSKFFIDATQVLFGETESQLIQVDCDTFSDLSSDRKPNLDS